MLWIARCPSGKEESGSLTRHPPRDLTTFCTFSWRVVLCIAHGKTTSSLCCTSQICRLCDHSFITETWAIVVTRSPILALTKQDNSPQEHCKHPNPKWNPQIPSGCTPPGTDGWGCNCANGTQPCDVGQSCLWFSDGCSIGCEACDGTNPVPHHCTAHSRCGNAGLGGNPNTRDRCNSGLNATGDRAQCQSETDVTLCCLVCDPALRTYNQGN